ncbi:MAG: nucleotidyltransferase, partial [Firmicutes bacterium]|nr:nucleotidyltransferase [Bacillota bacterium]
MAIKIKSAFIKFCQNIETTGLQKHIISKRQQGIRKVLSKEMNIIDSFLIGSYSRSTMIAPLKDSDID